MLTSPATTNEPPLGLLLLGGTFVATLFAALGFAIATDWRGFTTHHVQRTVGFARSMRKNRDRDRVFRRLYRLERYVLGPSFAAAGVLALVAVVVAWVHALLT